MFKASDAKAWQHEFPVGFPVIVCASNLLLINIFLDSVARIESRCVIKAKHVLLVCQFVRLFAGKTALALKRSCFLFLRKIERINRPTRHVLLQNNDWSLTWLSLWAFKRQTPQFNIKISSYQYMKSHCGDKTVVRSSYLHNVILYW